MVVSSTDGYCSLVSFAPGELGEVYHESQNGHQHETTPPPTIQHSLNNNKMNGEVTPAEKADIPTKHVDRALTLTESNNSPTAKTLASVDKTPIQTDVKITSLEKDVTPADKPATPVDTTTKNPIVIRRAGDR